MWTEGSPQGLREEELAATSSMAKFFERGDPFFDVGQSIASHSCSGFHAFVDALEVIPGDALYRGAQNQISVALPSFQLVFLCGADGAAHDLEDILWRAAFAVVDRDGNPENDLRAEVASGLGRHWGDETTVGQVAGSDLYRFEETRKGTARADGFGEVALGENDRITRAEVGGDDGRGNRQTFKLSRVKATMDKVAETLVAGKAEAGDAPARKIAEANLAATVDERGERHAAGIGRADDAAHAAAADADNGNVVLLEHAKHSEMRVATGETAAEGQADADRKGPGLGGGHAGRNRQSHGDYDLKSRKGEAMGRPFRENGTKVPVLKSLGGRGKSLPGVRKY